MKMSAFHQVRLAGAYCFLGPGMIYGLVSSRLPALKLQAQVNDAQIGLVLLAFGLAAVLALILGVIAIAKIGSVRSLKLAVLTFIAAASVGCLATSFLQLAISFAIIGFGIGLADVSLNVQGISIERWFTRRCMGFMHAAYSIGGALGAMFGAVFAFFNVSPFVNILPIAGLYVGLLPLVLPKLINEHGGRPRPGDCSQVKVFSIFVVVLGLMSMFAYVIEGASAEWGALFLSGYKGAAPSTAALAFAFFSIPMMLLRLHVDALRERFSDFKLAFIGASTAAFGMFLVLFSSQIKYCLAGYALTGFGLAPIVPILFSRAGNLPKINPVKAVSQVAFLSYSGLLFFPALLGIAAESYGLNNALLMVLWLCLLIILGSIALKDRN